MADDSRRHGLEPIPLRLTASPQQIEDELHRSMWDLATGQASATDDSSVAHSAPPPGTSGLLLFTGLFASTVAAGRALPRVRRR